MTTILRGEKGPLVVPVDSGRSVLRFYDRLPMLTPLFISSSGISLQSQMTHSYKYLLIIIFVCLFYFLPLPFISCFAALV